MAQNIEQEQEPRSTGQNVASSHANSLNFEISRPSLSEALSKLPSRYFEALTKPSVRTFSQGASQASWSLVWIQLLAWAILDAALGTLVNLISPPPTGPGSLLSLTTSVGLVAIVPILFFLIMGVTYFVARAFGGQGTFLEQCNTSLYIQAPLGIVSKLLALIPLVGRILNSVLSIYGIVLQVVVIMAVHRLSRGRAIGVVVGSLLVVAVAGGLIFALVLMLWKF